MAMVDSKGNKRQVLVLRTSNDRTMQVLFKKLINCNIYCLVQTDNVHRLNSEYPDITFIDIRRPSFYDIPEYVLEQVISNNYDEVYILLSGIHGYNYGNVMDILRKCTYVNGWFFNGNGECILIPRFNLIHKLLIGLYVKIVNLVYK